MSVVRQSGKIEYVAPRDIFDDEDPPIEFCWGRSEFDIANLQFMIGLLHAFLPPAPGKYHGYKTKGITPEQFDGATKDFVHCFNFTGDGPLFMQDNNIDKTPKSVKNISKIFMEALSEQGEKRNLDITQHKTQPRQLSLPVTAIAHYTRQQLGTNRSGGFAGPLAGYRVFSREVGSTTLADMCMLNTPDGTAINISDIPSIFTWMNGEKRGVPILDRVQPDDGNKISPAVWFIVHNRSVFGDVSEGHCDFTGCDTLVIRDMWRARGGERCVYGAWNNPAIFYHYKDKQEKEKIPAGMYPINNLKLEEGKLTFDNYVGMLFSSTKQRACETVSGYVKSRVGGNIDIVIGGFEYNQAEVLSTISETHSIPIDKLSDRDLFVVAGIVEGIGKMTYTTQRKITDLYTTNSKASVFMIKRELIEEIEPHFIEFLSNISTLTDASQKLHTQVRRICMSKFNHHMDIVVPNTTSESRMPVIFGLDKQMGTSLSSKKIKQLFGL